MNGEVKGESRQNLSHVCCVTLDDNSLRQFWEVEDHDLQKPILSQEEKIIIEHFKKCHIRDKEGRLIVPLLRKASVTPLGKSRTQTIHRFKRKSCKNISGWVTQRRYHWRKWTAHARRCITFPCTLSTKKIVLPASFVLFSMLLQTQHWVLCRMTICLFGLQYTLC